MFMQVADIGLLIPRAPGTSTRYFINHCERIERVRRVVFKYGCEKIWKFSPSSNRIHFILPDISSSSLMRSLSMSGGSLLEKKSFRAVATAFTGISSECMSTLTSVKRKGESERIEEVVHVQFSIALLTIKFSYPKNRHLPIIRERHASAITLFMTQN